MSEKDFYTFREYMKKEVNALTASMEDYLEMICRLSLPTGFTRINDLASALNVQPPSATKMVQRLAALEMVKYERYGVIILKEKGHQLGNMLLKRHCIVEEFLTLIGISENMLLEETEKIEHTIDPQTLECIHNFITFFKSKPQIVEEFNGMLKSSPKPG